MVTVSHCKAQIRASFMVEQKCVNIYCFMLHQLTTFEVGLTTMVWQKCVVETILWLECNNLKGKDHN